ncbi:ankyrin repeat and MYND domain-containing protein 1-like [Epargyreus clarus]|uniref:ankyrin repeat and MYND domain-containing protein 1-like n=1 Tax=Epargyreus clarus TaxID=520877 RepID=UPI003C2B0BFB
MVITVSPCELPKTKAEKSWPYVQYYVGDKDKQQRKNGEGDNCWSGAKSLERYTGHLVRDTMHGEGKYRWRYLGPDGTFGTYEGHFFNNLLHGYGSMSYGDGEVFKGIFHSNMRWGPGIESHACVKEDVGLWNGRQLIRLCWRPFGPNIVPDLMSSNIGRDVVKPHRKIMSSSVKTLGKVNTALELLKHHGANPLTAVDKWAKIYPTHCTDMSSALCHTEMFEHEYYNGKIYTLEEYVEVPESIENSSESTQAVGNFYAWNNNDIMKHMMRHCYKNESQRNLLDLDISTILSGPRSRFKPAGQHEIDSRTLLMACYLGHISQVAQLINEKKIHPDIADVLGNTAVMYATCGERAEVVHFLVEAGANVNSYNDSCCTPLGVALIKLVCAQKEIPINSMLQALLPTYVAPPSSSIENVFEWFTSRETQTVLPSIGTMLNKSPSKTTRSLSAKKIKSLASLKEQPGAKKKAEPAPPKVPEQSSEESFSEDKRVYNNINREFSIRVNDAYQVISLNPVPYLFEVNDMVKEVDASEEDHKKVPEKNPKKAISKVLKEATKPSKDAMWQNDKDENKSVDSAEKQRRDSLMRIMATIFQLLCDGADPKLVKCPQPALFIAIISGSSEAVTHLICYGADINEVYPLVLGYTALDIALSQPFTYDNLEIVKVLLEHGADTQHRLEYDTTNELKTDVLGPTLLHAILARRTECEIEEEIRRELLELLLDYNCIPTMQFKGKSAIDIAMMKSMDVFDIFIRNSKTNLNSVINDLHQSVLVKMFSLPFFKTIGGTVRLQKITDLLLFGANPLVECQNGEEKYENIFVFAKKTLYDIEGNQTKSATPTGPGGKKLEKTKKEDKISTKSLGRMIDDIGEYKQAVDLVTECARLLHIRWLQAELMKELINVVKKYSHRHWNMILKELKCKKNIGLWVLPQRSLEIWNILANAKKKAYSDRHILKHVLNIVQFCSYRIMNAISFRKPVTVIEKEIVEKNTSSLLHDQKDSESLNSEVLWKRCYVKPELITNVGKIFNVCFECALPLIEDKITCISCKLVSFCSIECIKININRVNCHPCNQFLKDKYFSSNSDSVPPDF